MWRTETRFIRDFLNSADPTRKSLHVLKEFRTGYGLPDLLKIEYDKNILVKRRRNSKSRKLKHFDIDCAYVMAYLSERRWIKLNNLKSNTNLYNGSIKTIIDKLRERGLVIKKGDKIKSKPKKEVFAIKSIVAIEAKLRQWKRAIFQAQRYLWFTNNSNILVPTNCNRQLSKIINSCKKYHVGLITLSKDKKILTIIKRKKRKPYNTYLAWLLNELLLDRIKR